MADQELPSVSVPVTNLVLVGRSVNGICTTGNTLLGRNKFSSEVMHCQMYRTVTPDGQMINVIKTPGMFSIKIINRNYTSMDILNNSHYTVVSKSDKAELIVLS